MAACPSAWCTSRCTTACSDSSSCASISRRRVVRSKIPRARAVDAGTQDDAVQGWIRALGGAGNLVAVDACTTRLRLSIADQKAVNEAALKSLGARGLVRPSQQTLQVVVGPIADQLASSIRAGLRLAGERCIRITSAGRACSVSAAVELRSRRSNCYRRSAASRTSATCERRASRICFTVRDDAAVSADVAKLAGVRGIARPMAHSIHILIGPAAPDVLAELGRLRV